MMNLAILIPAEDQGRGCLFEIKECSFIDSNLFDDEDDGEIRQLNNKC